MKITFHTFEIGEVEDPELYIYDPIDSWKRTEVGAWAMSHAQGLSYNIIPRQLYGYTITITGYVDPGPELTEYLLKWHNKES